MKRIITLILALALCLCAFACAEENLVGHISLFGASNEELQADLAEKPQEFYDAEDLESGMRSNVFFDNLTTMLLALNANDIQEIGVGVSTAEYIALRNENLTWSKGDELYDHFCMMVMEENQEIYDILNSAILEMKADGTLDQLIENDLRAYITSDPKSEKLPEIKGAKTIRVAVTGDLPPMDYVAVDGTPAGFNVALLAEIANRAQVNFDVVQVDSAARSTALASGRVDAIFWSKHIALSQEETVAWAESLPGAKATECYFAEQFGRVTMK